MTTTPVDPRPKPAWTRALPALALVAAVWGGAASASPVHIVALSLTLNPPTGWKLVEDAGPKGCAFATPAGDRVEVVVWKPVDPKEAPLDAAKVARDHGILLERNYGFIQQNQTPAPAPFGGDGILVSGTAKRSGDTWAGAYLAFPLDSDHGCVIGCFTPESEGETVAATDVFKLVEALHAEGQAPATLVARPASQPASQTASQTAPQPASQPSPLSAGATPGHPASPPGGAAQPALAATKAGLLPGADTQPLKTTAARGHASLGPMVVARPGGESSRALFAQASVLTGSKPRVRGKEDQMAAAPEAAGPGGAHAAQGAVSGTGPELLAGRPANRTGAALTAAAPAHATTGEEQPTVAALAGRQQAAPPGPTVAPGYAPLRIGEAARPASGPVLLASTIPSPAASELAEAAPPSLVMPTTTAHLATATPPSPVRAALVETHPQQAAGLSLAAREPAATNIAPRLASRVTVPAAKMATPPPQPAVGGAAGALVSVPPTSQPAARPASSGAGGRAPEAGRLAKPGWASDASGRLRVPVPEGWKVTVKTSEGPGGPAVSVSGALIADPAVRFRWVQPALPRYRQLSQLLTAMGYAEWEQYKDPATREVLTVAKRRTPRRLLDDVVLPGGGSEGMQSWQVLDTQPSALAAGLVGGDAQGLVAHVLGASGRRALEAWCSVASGTPPGQSGQIWVGAWMEALDAPGHRRALKALEGVVTGAKTGPGAGAPLQRIITAALAAAGDLVRSATPAH